MQGELFYGVKIAVPAFSFLDRSRGRLVRMFEPEPAAALQAQLEANRKSLLAGGSAYANIYSGGAAEPHFCAATTGWGELARAVNPLALAGVVLWHGASAVRTATLMLVELALAIVDIVRSPFLATDLRQEIKFISSRVGVSILLRELVTIGASLDVTRGLPVVHANFLGYDEQAHRRGPSSAFAHWSLLGIDRAIADIFAAARRSPRRDYDVWIYADHGQEEVIPYEQENGRPVQEAIAEVFARVADFAPPAEAAPRRGEQSGRARWLGGGRVARFFGSRQPAGPAVDVESQVVVAAMGPLGHVYPPHKLQPCHLQRVASELVHAARIPLVLYADGEGSARALNARGTFQLPQQGAEVLGAEHPFLEVAARELVELCHHPNAGTLVISGWRPGEKPMSFPIERGAHGGPGSEETRSFALLPGHIAAGEPSRDYLRASDLRETAQYVLGRASLPSRGRSVRRPRRPKMMRIMTYNVHSCFGMDGKLSPTRIARVIAQADPDVVALQELDVGRPRTGAIDQAHAIAEELEMSFHFHPALEVEEEQYGDAVLSRLPMRLIRAAGLPTLPTRRLLEPRGALWVEIALDGIELQLINTHLGLSRRERLVQTEALLGPDWLAHPHCVEPLVLCGDLNALPKSEVCRRLGQRLRDAQTLLDDHRPQRTWFSGYPVGRIDHVFVSPDIRVQAVDVPRGDLARVASDHLPLVVDIQIG